MNHAEAYREASGRKDIASERAKQMGWRLSSRLAVAERIEEIRALSKRKSILSLNDRLEGLAFIIQDPNATNADKIRAIVAYSQISGDQAPQPPQKIEISTPAGGAFVVATRKLTVKEKIAQLRTAREIGRGEPVSQPPSLPAGEPAAAPAADPGSS